MIENSKPVLLLATLLTLHRIFTNGPVVSGVTSLTKWDAAGLSFELLKLYSSFCLVFFPQLLPDACLNYWLHTSTAARENEAGEEMLENNNLGASLPPAAGSGTLLQSVIGTLPGN